MTLHVNLSPETRHLIDATTLAWMKPTAVLVNTSRGPVVDGQALADALRDGTIAAAALDVTDPEPIPMDDPLVGLDNCLIVPHIASASRATRGEDGRDGGGEPARRGQRASGFRRRSRPTELRPRRGSRYRRGSRHRVPCRRAGSSAAEHGTFNPLVVGSNPTRLAAHFVHESGSWRGLWVLSCAADCSITQQHTRTST